MKRIALVIFGLVLSVPVFAWNCPTGQIRQQAPTGTPTTTPYYDVVEGIAFICVPSTPPTTPVPPNAVNTNTNTANSAANSVSTSGASATGGSASSNQTQKQKQQQSQTQSNTSTNTNANSSQSAGGSVSDVGNSQTTVEAPKIPVNTAVAPPVFSTTNCFKGFSAGGQTAVGGLSFGGGGIDKNCSALITAQDYFAMGNRLAACKVITSTKASKDAGVTLADCMNVPVPVVRTVVPVVSAPVPAPVTVQITNNIPPAPAPIILHEEMTVTAPRPQAKKRVVHRPCSVTPIQNACPTGPQEK